MHMNDKPIFIGGLQRSGTSLIRAIIGSHPEVAIFQWDLPLWTYYYERYRTKCVNSVEYCNQLIDDIFSDEDIRECDVSLDWNAIREELATEPKISCGVIFRHILQAYAKQIGRPRWGLKTPHNEFYADPIFQEFPNAKMIQLVRDPRDVAVSYKSYDKGAWKYDILQHIHTWKRSVEVARKNESKYTGSFITVRYEDLVSNPESVVRKICKIIDLDYSSDLLEMSNHIGWKGGNSFFEDIGTDAKQIRLSAIGRYKEHLPVSQIWLYQYMLKDEMHYWNYQKHRVKLSFKDYYSIVQQSIQSVVSSARIIIVNALRGTPLYIILKRIFRALK